MHDIQLDNSTTLTALWGMSESLTAKQKMFCQEYLIDLNATQAAIRAGYSKDTAKEIGYENLTKPYVSDFLQSLLNERSERVQIDADYVLGAIKETLEKSRAGDDRPNVYKGAELLGKHLKLFTDKVEHSGGINIMRLDDDDMKL